MARRTELSAFCIADIEHNRRVPRLDALQRIAAVFDQDAVTLLGGVTLYDRSS